MSNQSYTGTAERTFGQALIYLLEHNYGLLGSRRVLELLAEDVGQLVEQFYPPPDRLPAGWMLFTGTRASGSKAHPGQQAGEHELVTLAWPVLLAEDAEFLVNRDERVGVRREWFRRRLIRIIEHGQAAPGGAVLLTNADLSCILGIRMAEVSALLTEARQETGKPLLTKGYYFDQGFRPSHKEPILALYEAGLDEAEIARRSQHSPDSVGRYIRDYERIKTLLKHHTPLVDIPQLIGIQPSVVHSYATILAQFHPELLPSSQSPAPPQSGDKGDI